jgi:hypothetical protein
MTASRLAGTRRRHSRLEGSGVLTYTDELRLSDPKSGSVSVWKLPAAFHPAVGGRLSYHADAARCDEPVGMTRLRTVGRGQEFVAATTPAMAAWARRLITTNS